MTTLTVELADEQMRVLERVAAQRGLSVPALLSDLATQCATPQAGNTAALHQDNSSAGNGFNNSLNGSAALEDVENDPLWKACGSLNSGIRDLAERHDEYLSQSYLETHDHK